MTSDSKPSVWDPFRHSVFRWLWFATVVSNIGGWMYNAAAGWLMISLHGSPLMVSLVQVASSLPLFMFALPAGAVADIVDRRRFILGLEVLMTVSSALFAFVVTSGRATPELLLLFMLLVGTLSAWEAPAWQAIVPDLVPKKDLGGAVAINSVGVNISRAIGPALAGILIVAWGIGAPFWLDAVSNLGVIGVFLWWRSKQARPQSAPAERFMSAMTAGLRHARNNSHLRATLARSAGFFLFASAYWALLPLVVHDQIAGGPEVYGALLGAIGAGALAVAFALPRLKARMGPNGVVALGQAGTAVSLVLFGLAHELIMAMAASIIAGMCWIAVVANLNISAQVALPNWVRGRGLALYVTVFFGTMTIGSALWGELADVAGLPMALFVAAGGAFAAVGLTYHWKLQTGAALDLTPSMHWPDPIIDKAVEGDAGPVLVTVEYRVVAHHRKAFLTALEKISRERKRDGAYAWGVFEDTGHDGHFIETFMLESWLEHLRQHRRVTNADRALEQHMQRHIAHPPTVTHYVAVRSDDRDNPVKKDVLNK
jgi:MFS family permease